MTELTANDKGEFILKKLIRITNSGELKWKHEKGERLGVWRGCKYYIKKGGKMGVIILSTLLIDGRIMR